MTRFAIDPVAFLEVARSDRTLDVAHQLVAPHSLRTRGLELLLGEVRRGDLTEREALAVHRRLTEIKVRLLGDSVSRRTAWNLARDHGWDDLGDAEYLAVAVLQADTFVALDPALVAKAEGIVSLTSVDRLYQG